MVAMQPPQDHFHDGAPDRAGAPTPSTTTTSCQPPANSALALGLGGLALLFPLAELTGVADAIGEAPTALGLLALVGTAWVLTVGLSDVARPVATLTCAGLVYGLVLVVLSVPLGVPDERSPLVLAVVALFEVARSTALGALAGLLAAGLQRTVGRRR